MLNIFPNSVLPQVFCEPADYRKHIKTTHYQCLRCVFNTNVEAAFRTHFLQKHAAEAAAAASGQHPPTSTAPPSNPVAVTKLMPVTAAPPPASNPAVIRPAANFRCPFCATVMPAKENWISHLRSAHAERAPSVCHVCTMGKWNSGMGKLNIAIM